MTQLFGRFHLNDGEVLLGRLLIAAEKSRLTLDGLKPIRAKEKFGIIKGETLDLKKVSCIKCINFGNTSKHRKGKPATYSLDLFPHFILVGDVYLDPEKLSVSSYRFQLSDGNAIFHEPDEYGQLWPCGKDDLKKIFPRDKDFPKVGQPEILYFLGNYTQLEAETALGKVTVGRFMEFNGGGPEGIWAKNQNIVYVDLLQPIGFHQAVQDILSLRTFFSYIAGRKQGINGIKIEVSSENEKHSLELHWSMAAEIEGEDDPKTTPAFYATPIRISSERDQLKSVMIAWLRDQPKMKQARNRYLGCISKGANYDVDRLVAAANMFDLLPKERLPPLIPLSKEFILVRQNCLDLLGKLPDGIEKNTAVDGLKRAGNSSLPKKASYCADLVIADLGPEYQVIKPLVRQAILCRNHFVHGTEIKQFHIIEPFIPALTDCLEFVFAASDLIACEWNALAWSHRCRGFGHGFARFLHALPFLEGDMREAGINI